MPDLSAINLAPCEKFPLYGIMLYLQAEEVLLSTVTSGVGPAEKWASVQALVHARVVTAPVISELLGHLHDSQQHQSGRRERAADLLARSSAFTVSTQVECFAEETASLFSHAYMYYDSFKFNITTVALSMRGKLKLDCEFNSSHVL